MRWIVVSIALLVVAVALGLGLFAYAIYALLGVIFLSRVLADRWSGELTATRSINRDHVKIGDTVAVVTVIENRGWLPIPWLLLEDLLPRRALIHNPPNLQITGRRLQLVSFAGRGRKTLSYQLKCNCRGYYQLGPLVAETGDVFGLYRRYRILSEPSFVLVYPEVVPLTGFDIASRRPIGEVRMSHRLFEDPTRIAGVRGYQAGDPLNRIHWRATASTGLLHSKIYEPSTVAGATILLDFHRASFPEQDEPVRSELAVTAAASLAGALAQMGQQVGLITNGRDAAERIRREGWTHDQLRTRREAQAVADERDNHRLAPVIVPTRRSNIQLSQILETLARLEKSDGLPFPALVHETASRMPHSATVIALLSNVTTEAALALGNLRRRGMAVTAIVSVYDAYDFGRIVGPLVAERIEVRQLRDRVGVARMCQRMVLR
ncbi:MAG: DUF58 domain-containing protein [Pirellulales bacterium]